MNQGQPKIAEKLTILTETGNAIIQRLAHLKKICNNPVQRPVFLTDTQFAKVNAALLKKFPEFESNVEKTPGYELFTAKAKVFFEKLEPIYFTFVDTFEWKEATLGTLAEIATQMVDLTLFDNPILTTAFLDLFVLYVQVNGMVSSLEDRKILLAVYYRLFFFIKCSSEPNWVRIANYAVMCDQPIKLLQEEFKGSVGTSMGKILTNLISVYSKLREIPRIRKEGLLSISLKPEEMAKPVTDKLHYQAHLSYQIHCWISYGLLLCPEAFANPGTMDLCKMILSESYAFPIYRSSVFELHIHYDNLFNNYKSKTVNLSKNKKLPKDALAELVKAPGKHKERRIYLRQELNSLYKLFTDKPGLLGPKFPILLCALSLAKEEIFWYFRHFKILPKVLKKLSEDEFRDSKICEFIWLFDNFKHLLEKYAPIIKLYYLEYLRGAHLRKVLELCDNNFMNSVGPNIAAIYRAAFEDLQKINMEDFRRGQQYDFRTLRLNFLRVESVLSSMTSPIQLAKIKELADRATLISYHSRFVDDIPNLVEEYVSLKGLWYYREILSESYTRALQDGPNQPLFTVSYLRLFSEFSQNANQYNPEEREEIGPQCVSLCEKMCMELAQRAMALVNTVAKTFTVWDSHCADVNAAYPLLQKKKDWKPPKDFVPPETPGTESSFPRRVAIENVRLYERNGHQLCTALNECDSVLIHDSLIAPREFLREKIAEGLKHFCRSVCVVEIQEGGKVVEKLIQRPSILEKQFTVYTTVIQMMENFGDFDLNSLIREVLLGEIYSPGVGKTGTYDYVTADDSAFKLENSLIFSLASWYGEFISRRCLQSGVVYSPLRKGFYSKSGMPFRAELYADINELKSLVRLVGPYGIKIIDREILKVIQNNLTGIKESVSHNKQTVEQLLRSYRSEEQCLEIFKKIRDMDSFITKSITVGNALAFRALLREALDLSIGENLPYISNVVKSGYSEYRSNTFMSAEFLGMDSLASDVGAEVNTADQALKRCIGRVIGAVDAPLWDLLPVMFAASFGCATQWREAIYKPILEGHLNNCHVLSKTINELIIALKSLTPAAVADEKEIVTCLYRFLEISSIILLRMLRAPFKNDKYQPVDFPSILVFLDKFVEESPLLTHDVLEKCLPYALLRNEWKHIYATKLSKDKKEVGEVF